MGWNDKSIHLIRGAKVKPVEAVEKPKKKEVVKEPAKVELEPDKK